MLDVYSGIRLRCKMGEIIKLGEIIDSVVVDHTQETTQRFLKPGRDYCGVCKFIGGEFVAHFVFDNDLFVYADGNVWRLSEIDVKHRIRFGTAYLELSGAGGETVSLKYSIADSLSDIMSILFRIDIDDLEDADYGLFIYNIKNSDERRRVIIETFMTAENTTCTST